MTKKNAWKIELKLLSRFLNVLANNDFKWKDGEKVADFNPFCFSEIMLLVEESPKVISYTEYYLYISTSKEEYNIIEVTEEMLRGMESVLQNHALCDNGGVFKPEYGQRYWYIINSNTVRTEWWNDYPIDRDYYEIGNCFPIRESAKDTIRALRLIQRARESQGGSVLDWKDWEQEKHCLAFDERGVFVASFTSINTVPMFGFWEDKSACEKFINENYDELLWFFAEYQR